MEQQLFQRTDDDQIDHNALLDGLIEQVSQESQQKSRSNGGGCSSPSQNGEDQTSDDADEWWKQNDEERNAAIEKLEIEDNSELPENWWDRLPDFDPRIYDAIAMEQAAACVKYVFDGLPDIHELENTIESRKNRKTCPRLKTKVPRTKIQKPKEIEVKVLIDAYADKKDQTY